MSRAVLGGILAMTLVACAGDSEIDGSTETDPTVDFNISPFDVDTARPVDTGYPGTRRRGPDTGWRLNLPDTGAPDTDL